MLESEVKKITAIEVPSAKRLTCSPGSACAPKAQTRSGTVSWSAFSPALLGIGGGAVTVPLLVWALGAQALPGEHVMRLALGTSMAVIFFTSISSIACPPAARRGGLGDRARDGARHPRRLVPGAALAAAYIPTRGLAVVFTVLALYAAVQMSVRAAASAQPHAAGRGGPVRCRGRNRRRFQPVRGRRRLSHRAVPGLVQRSHPPRHRHGRGQRLSDRARRYRRLCAAKACAPKGCRGATLGYVYLPALVLIVVASMSMAPIGARTAYRVPVKALRIVFAILIAAMALRTLATLW